MSGANERVAHVFTDVFPVAEGTHRSQHLTTTRSVYKVDSLATDSQDPSPHLSVNVILGLMAEYEIPFFLEGSYL
jgi:hypothetical protein